MELARMPKLRKATYKIELRVWLNKDGHIAREELASGSGSTELDALLREGLLQVGPLRQSVPDNLPQPIRIRVTSADS
jgi:protein TonB